MTGQRCRCTVVSQGIRHQAWDGAFLPGRSLAGHWPATGRGHSFPPLGAVASYLSTAPPSPAGPHSHLTATPGSVLECGRA